MQRGLKGTQLKEVSSPKLVYEFIINKVLGGSGRATVSDVLDDEFVVLESNASVGGGASETLVVTGLLASDEILSATQRVAGANGVAMVGYSGQVADALDVDWTADPGAGAVVRLLVRRA